jgi:hypothetical protein
VTADMTDKPLTPEEEAAIRERHRLCSRPMAWHVDVHRLLATLDAARSADPGGLRPDWKALYNDLAPLVGNRDSALLAVLIKHRNATPTEDQP